MSSKISTDYRKKTQIDDSIPPYLSSLGSLKKRPIPFKPSLSTPEQPLKKRKVEHVNGTTTYKILTPAERVAKLKLVDVLTQSATTTDSESDKLESQKLAFELALQVEKSDYIILKKKHDELKAESDKTKQNFIELQQKQTIHGRDLKQYYATHKTKIENLNNEITRLKNANESHQSKEKESAQDIEKMKERIHALEAEVEVSKKEMALLFDENKELTDERNGSRRALTEEILKVKDFQAENMKLGKETGDLRTQYQEKFVGLQQTLSTQGADLNAIAHRILSFADTVRDLGKIQ
jgi:chromosome segregation ATPase